MKFWVPILAALAALPAFSATEYEAASKHRDNLLPKITRSGLGLDLGFYWEKSAFSSYGSEIQYKIDGKKLDTEIDLSDIFGVYAAYKLPRYASVYSKWTYQYMDISYGSGADYAMLASNEKLDSSDVNGQMDIHLLTLELGIELRLLLFEIESLPVHFYFIVNGGLIGGVALYDSDAYFETPPVFGYSHGVGFRLESKARSYISCGFDWSHHYSDADPDHGSGRLLIDYDRSGFLFLTYGFMF